MSVREYTAVVIECIIVMQSTSRNTPLQVTGLLSNITSLKVQTYNQLSVL